MFICRVCLTLEDNLYPIATTYTKAFEECTGISEVKYDFLCPTCIRKLTEAHAFRSQALKSDEILKSNMQELLTSHVKQEPVDAEEVENENQVIQKVESVVSSISPETPIEFDMPVVEEDDDSDEWPIESSNALLEVMIKQEADGSVTIASPDKKKRKKKDPDEVDTTRSIRSIKAKLAWTEDTKKFLIKNCPYCFYYSKNKIEMRDHIQEHITQNGGVECDHCGKKWPSKLRLYEHLHKIFKGGYKRQKSSLDKNNDSKTVQRKRMFKCDYCIEAYEEKHLVDIHIAMVHPNAEQQHNFLCNTCGKTFPNQKKLRNHLQRHKEPKEDKPFSCHYCGKRFKLKASQQYHLLGHTDERNFTCSTCGSRFKTKQALRDHEPIHTGELNYQCDGCDKRFRSRGLLRSHRLVHFEGKFSCDICGLKFRRTSNLNDHMLCHTERRDYSCNLCGTLFKAQASLKRHMKKHHEKSSASIPIDMHRAVPLLPPPSTINSSMQNQPAIVQMVHSPPIQVQPIQSIVQSPIIYSHHLQSP